MSDTPRTDAHLSHLNLSDGRKIGIPDQTLDLMRHMERELAEARAEVSALKHDIERHISIASEEATRAERAEYELAETKDILLQSTHESRNGTHTDWWSVAIDYRRKLKRAEARLAERDQQLVDCVVEKDQMRDRLAAIDSASYARFVTARML